jgi:serine/threonine protein kinase/Tfp pilus assembly protein PilF
MLLQPGSRPVPNCSDYVLIRRLGAGAFGEVWHAHGPGGLAVALKFIRLDAQVLALELRSLEAMRHIRHPNLVSLFGAWHKDHWLILAMELCDRSLQDRLAEALGQNLPGIPLVELLGYMSDAANGLDALNAKQVQHRDVKPANLLLLDSGVKVADFGLAKVLEHTVGSNTGAGTLAYTAPECFKGKLAQQSDQYSLAVTYYHLRTGRLLFKGDQAQVMYAHLELDPDLSVLPPEEKVVLARALAKEPGMRWPSCGVFVNELTMAYERAAEEDRQRQEANRRRRNQDGQRHEPVAAREGQDQSSDAPPPEYTLLKAVAVCLAFILFPPVAMFGFGSSSRPKPPVWAVTLQQKEEWLKAQPTPWEKASVGEKIERVAVAETLLAAGPVVLVCWGYLRTKRAERRWCQRVPGRTLADLKAARAELARVTTASSYFERAAYWYVKKDHAKAIANADEAIRLDPKCASTSHENISAYRLRGQCWYEMGQYDKAIRDFDEAIRLDPKIATLYVCRGKAWREKKEYDKAIKDLDQAIQLGPKDDGAYNNRGQTWLKKEYYDNAITDLDNAIRFGYDGADGFGSRGMAWYGKRDYDKAINDFNEAIRRDKSYARAYICIRGVASSAKNQHPQAAEDFRMAIQLDPGDATSHGCLARLLASCPEHALRDSKVAIQMATKACELTKWENGWALSILAMAYRSDGQFEEADRHQSMALEHTASQGRPVATSPALFER